MKTSRTLCLVPLVGLAAALSAHASDGKDDRAYLAGLFADASTRTSLQGADAGHDGKFHLSSSDGNYRLNVSGQVQFRYIANFRDNANDNSFEHGFQTRRTKIAFSGHVINEDLSFKVNGAFDRKGGAFELEDAYVKNKIGDGWSLRWGQYKLPMLREENISSKYQQAVDRSVVNEVFNQDRTQGIELAYKADDWRAFADFSVGFKTANSDFTSPATSPEADYAFTGRVDYKVMGNWKQFKDFTSFRGSDDAALIGGGVHYQQSANTNALADVDTSFFQYTVDASYESDGWNVYAAFVGRNTNIRAMGSDVDFNDLGFVVQGGLFVSEEAELFARFDSVLPDSDRVGDNSFNTVTVGTNYYFLPESHAAKLTADVQFFLDDMSQNDKVKQNTGIGLLTDANDNQVAFRVQFQLLF